MGNLASQVLPLQGQRGYELQYRICTNDALLNDNPTYDPYWQEMEPDDLVLFSTG